MLVASCCENDVVGFVLPFVKENIGRAEWQNRDAAVMALGRVVTYHFTHSRYSYQLLNKQLSSQL